MVICLLGIILSSIVWELKHPASRLLLMSPIFALFGISPGGLAIPTLWPCPRVPPFTHSAGMDQEPAAFRRCGAPRGTGGGAKDTSPSLLLAIPNSH